MSELKQAWQRIADITNDKCKNACRVKLSCCSPEYCAMTIDYAKESWNVELPMMDHPTLPLMGAQGCTASPHLRPLCAMHVCEMNYLKDQTFAEEYFNLRERINDLEMARTR